MRIFVSSTYLDLQEVRDRLIKSLMKAGKSPAAMEVFGARSDLPLDSCLQELRRSDVVVLMIGAQYGSVESKSGLSYTHLEFREAVGCGIPVLALVLKPPAAAVSPAKGKHPDRLKAFREEVLRGPVTADRVDEPNEFPGAAMAALMRFRDEQANRIGQFRTFQDGQDYFANQLNSAAIFNHAHDLIGRGKLLSELESFLEDSDLFVAILPGAGGSGKSKVLYELSKRRADGSPRLLFLGPQFSLDEERLKELPAGPVCIVVDDAHRLGSLDGMIRALVGTASARPLKLLLTCRPVGLAQIEHGLRGLPKEARRVLAQLPTLDLETEALALATTSLGTQYAGHAHRLVEISDGNPLIITVGGRLIQDRTLSADLLSQKEDFRTAALDGLLRDVPDSLAGSVPSRGLLQAMAAICPFRRGVENAEQLIADWLEASPWDIVRSIVELDVQHGLILKRGRIIRIQPDVLADHLLFTACVADGQPTGFLDGIVDRFGSAYLANALTNAAEVEWRCRMTGTPVDILGKVYGQIMDSLPSLTHRARAHLLEDLKEPSLFLPEKSWQLVSWLIEHPGAPEDTDPLSRAFPQDQSDVLRELPPIIARVGADEAFTAPCAAQLLDLAESDTRPTNPYPEHPMRVLCDMLEYQPGRPFSLQREGLRGLRVFVDSEAARGRYINLAARGRSWFFAAAQAA